MFILIIIREIVFIIVLLTLPSYLIYSAYIDHKRRKEHDNLVTDVKNRLLELADDEKPIMLNVNTDRLVEKVADEVEKRQSERNMLRRV